MERNGNMKKRPFKNKFLSVLCAVSLALSTAPVIHAAEPIAAFPGAEGAGMYATGGRGGTVVHVTNLNDSGTGSFRDAVSASNRIVVFDVGGTINLKSDVVVKGNITIAGQTAPGGAGITLRNGKLGMGGDNIIVRFISSRPGEKGEGSGDYDAWGGSAGSNSIIDHCSIGWANDEQFGLYSQNTNQTVQYTIVGPSNCVSYHSKGAHGFGAMFGKGQNTWHHNMLAHSLSRNFRGKVVGTNAMDFVNNVIYDWGYQTAYGTLGHINYVNNYLKAGPSTAGGYRFINISSGTAPENYKFFLTGNKIVDKNGDGTTNSTMAAVNANNWNGGINYGNAGYTEADYRSDTPFEVNDVNGNNASYASKAETADEAFETVLTYAGAGISSDKRPKIDQEVMEEARTGTGSLTGGRDFSTVTDDAVLSAIETYGIQYMNYDEYYPSAITAKEITDTDNDGMPDEWELERGLDPQDASDATDDYLGKGYNNIEYYINDLTIDAFPEGIVELSPTSVDLGPEYNNIKEDLAAITLDTKSIKLPSDLSLPQKGSVHDLDIVWTSSSSAIKIANNQIYQVNRKTDNQTVTLTASISSGEYNMSKSFSVTVVSNSSFWKANETDNAKPAGTELFDGLTTLFDAVYKASEVTINGEDFAGYISSSENGTLTDGKATGTAFKYEAAESGYLTAYIRNLGTAENAKTLYIVEEGASSNNDCIASASGNASNTALTAYVEAGKTYYIYVAGSKGQFMGMEFSLTPKTVWWKASRDVAAGEELMKNLTPSEALTYKESVKEIDGEAFSGAAAGSTNPSDNGASGAAICYIPDADGTFVFYCKVGSGKTMKINDADGNVVSEYKNEAAESEFASLSGELKAGVTYYAYVAGSRAEFYGASFTEYAKSAANTPIPTAAPAATPTATNTPAATDAPSVTDTPAATDAPSATDAPPANPQITVEKVTFSNDTISYDVENGSGYTLDTYIASYDGDTLINVKKHTDTVSDGKISFPYTDTIPDNIKVFVWNGMEPVYKSCILYYEQTN